jgi:hypothetical protein
VNAISHKHRLSDAYARDLRDADRVGVLLAMVSKWRDELAQADAPLEHPDARWQPAELLEQLDDALLDITGEADRLRGPVVAE